jgi:hypothetical protein
MRHMTGSVYAKFDREVHMYRGTTMAAIVQDEAKHDPSRGFAGGYEMETISLGLPFFAAFLDPGAWGANFTDFVDNDTNVAGMWLVGEDLPRDTNRVTLNTDVKDQYGVPVPNVHYDDSPKDVAMRDHAFERGEAIYKASGATKTFRTPPYPSTQNMGNSRMSADPKLGVVNKHGQTHDIAPPVHQRRQRVHDERGRESDFDDRHAGDPAIGIHYQSDSAAGDLKARSTLFAARGVTQKE